MHHVMELVFIRQSVYLDGDYIQSILVKDANPNVGSRLIVDQYHADISNQQKFLIDLSDNTIIAVGSTSKSIIV